MYIFLKQPHAERVESAYIPKIEIAEHGAYTLFHLCGSLVGECDTQYGRRIDTKHIGKETETSREGTGLARARSGNYPNRALGSGDSLGLAFVQSLEILH